MQPAWTFLAGSAIFVFYAVPYSSAASCENLAGLALENATITLAQSVAPGAFTLPPEAAARGGVGVAGDFSRLPAFCRVAATLKPSSDSDIRVEVWLPVSGWNRKYQAVGNGGWAGSIPYGTMGGALARGYAVSATDTGHLGGSGRFALGHPEKVADFAYRSEHEMALKSKAIIAAFYGDAPHWSYWVGCSSGGRQALKEAQKFPADFNGIIAGAPANDWTHLMFGRIWIAQATLKDPAGYIPASKYPVIHKAVLEACDTLDGVKDGVIDDPSRCHFDPKTIQCKDSDQPDCLTAAQVEAARKIYAGAKNPRTGSEIYPGMEPGSELGWATLAGGPNPFAPAVDHFKYVVFQNPDWDFRTLNFDSDVELADKLDAGISAVDPDLKAFVSQGGKLIQYHGWTDQQIPPRGSVRYHDRVVEKMGPKIADSYRLFMTPGMNHCGGGEGASNFDMVTALENWVEKGQAPEQIPASHLTGGKVDRTRLLCPYPQVAKYKGTGSTDDAANFVCRLP